MDDRERRMFACACASRALDREEASGRVVDPRSREAVRVARMYADGRATIEELGVAENAAMDAAYVSLNGKEAAWAACEACCCFSRIAAGSASWGAARASVDADDERIRQLEWILSEHLGGQD